MSAAARFSTRSSRRTGIIIANSCWLRAGESRRKGEEDECPEGRRNGQMPANRCPLRSQKSGQGLRHLPVQGRVDPNHDRSGKLSFSFFPNGRGEIVGKESQPTTHVLPRHEPGLKHEIASQSASRDPRAPKNLPKDCKKSSPLSKGGRRDLGGGPVPEISPWPPLIRGCVAIRKMSSFPRKRESRYLKFLFPPAAGMPALHHTRYRARLRGHDEIRHGL